MAGVVEKADTYKGHYLGHAACKYAKDKEAICHATVFAKFSAKSTR
jgi:hypothetical protein